MSEQQTPATALRLIEELAVKRRQDEAIAKAAKQAEDAKKLQDMFLYWSPITDILDAFKQAYPNKLTVFKPAIVYNGNISFKALEPAGSYRYELLRMPDGCRLTPRDKVDTPADLIPLVMDILANILK